MGLYSAYWLAKAGKKLILFEQYPIGHDNGRCFGSFTVTHVCSSHGDGRIVRSLNDLPVLTELASKSLGHFQDLEKVAKVQLVHNCGCVVIGTKEVLVDWENACKGAGSSRF